MYAIRSYYVDHGDGETEKNGLPITLKMLVIINVNHNIKITGRTATARITSYNVCYTKLLRSGLVGLDDITDPFK